MSNPLIQLSYTGFDKYFLSSTPDKLFLEPNYSTQPNFSTQILPIQPNQKADFGKKIVFEIPKYGQFVHNMQLTVNVPGLNKTSGNIAGWTNGFLYALVDKVELEIGGSIVDTRWGIQMDIRDELTSKPGHTQGKNLMSGKKEVINNTNDLDPRVFILNLDFWFNKIPSQSLPIALLNDQKVKINFYFKEFSECVVYDGDTEPIKVGITNCELLTEYYFIEKNLMKKFVEKSYSSEGLNYLIEKTVFNEYEILKENQNTHQTNLKFSQSVKELNWVMIEEESIDNNDWFNYSTRDDNKSPMKSAILSLDGITQTSDYLPENYFRLIQPQQFYNTIPIKYIYSYCFSRDPEKINNGSINLGMIDDAVLKFNMNSIKPSRLYVFATELRVFSIIKGSGNIVY